MEQGAKLVSYHMLIDSVVVRVTIPISSVNACSK